MEIDITNSQEENKEQLTEDTCPVHEDTLLTKGFCVICQVCYSCK